MKRLSIFSILLLALLMVPIQVSSQDNSSCAAVVNLALDATDQYCSGTGQNQACYGHMLIEAVPTAGAGNFSFFQAGDTADLLDLQTLRLSSMDVNAGLWGVALMNLQAYMQYAEPRNVQYLLFGDVEIQNQSETLTRLDVSVSASAYVNVRLGPTARAGVIGTLAPGQVVTAQGRLADNAWVRVILPDSGRVGWIASELISTAGDLNTLIVADARAPYYGPMQAVALRSGIDDSLCPEAPESGLLIQTPEGVAAVTLLVNGVDIQLSNATAFLQAQPGGDLAVDVLNGWVDVTAGGATQTGFAGTQISVPLDVSGAPSGPPTLPVPYNGSRAQSLPVEILADPVDIVEPPTPNQITATVAARHAAMQGNGAQNQHQNQNQNQNQNGQATAPGQSGSLPPGQGGSPPGLGGDPPPGQSGTPPGLGGNLPPGQGGSPPGLGGDPPPGQGGTPPGLGGNLPPGQGGTPPGQGGTPPGQAKKD